MTDWSVTWLGIIAISLALMALIQVVVLIAIARLALQAVRGVRELRSEMRPLIAKVNQIADDALAISGMAAVQVERLEGMLASMATRLDETMGAIHSVVTGPLRQGSAIVAAIKAIFGAFGRKSDGSRHPRDDEDALFVG